MKQIPLFMGLLVIGLTSYGYDRTTVDLDFVSNLAQDKAQQPFKDDVAQIPENLKNLSYDEYRNIRFRKSEALWLGQDYRFVIEFFHPGYLFNDPVLVYEATDTHMQQIPFARNFFNYDDSNLSSTEVAENIGFSGIRIRYPVNNPDVRDDVIVFHGASYFRSLGKDNAYGVSARGLGVGVGEGGETFPRFTQIWIKKPSDPNAESITIYALLDGQNVTGAYEFNLRPGEQTAVDVKSRVWPRGDPSKLCFAPLTSMYFFGENSEFTTPDWRPEVHDSDGLLIADGEQWIWRPLNNPESISRDNFPVDQLHGFGLLQRDRRFISYKDLEATYEKRPSLWITPTGEWPAGEVVLVEMPVDHETADNINTFWKPQSPPAKGQFYELNYRMSWRTAEPNEEVANVLETRIGQKTLDDSATSFVIEFSPPKGFNGSNLEEFTIQFDADDASVKTEPQLRFNKSENCIRAYFDLSQDPVKSHRLSLSLLHKDKPVTEQWVYLWEPRKS